MKKKKTPPARLSLTVGGISVDLGPLKLPPPRKETGQIKLAVPHKVTEQADPIQPPPAPSKDPWGQCWTYLEGCRRYDVGTPKMRQHIKAEYFLHFGEELPEKIPTEVAHKHIGYELAKRGHDALNVPLKAVVDHRRKVASSIFSQHRPTLRDTPGFVWRDGQALKPPPRKLPPPQKKALPPQVYAVKIDGVSVDKYEGLEIQMHTVPGNEKITHTIKPLPPVKKLPPPKKVK